MASSNRKRQMLRSSGADWLRPGVSRVPLSGVATEASLSSRAARRASERASRKLAKVTA